MGLSHAVHVYLRDVPLRYAIYHLAGLDWRGIDLTPRPVSSYNVIMSNYS